MPAEILILGGGFAGLAAAEALGCCDGRYRVRLIDRRRESVFAPLLPDLISGRVQPDHIEYPIEDACRRAGVEYVHANIKAIDLRERSVQAFEGEFRADYIIICLGCDTNCYDDEDIRRHTIGLKWVEEGVAINARAKKLIDDALLGGEPANIVIAGGGYTGIESASHLAYLAKTRAGLPYEEINRFARIMIVEKMDKLLPMVPGKAQTWAEEVMRGYNVEIRTNTTIQSLDHGNAVTLSDGTVLPRPLVLWTAGVAPGPAVMTIDTPKNGGHRLKVDQYMRLPGHTNVFAAGDVAAPEPPGHDLPMRMAVQFSLDGGRVAAENVKRAIAGRDLKEFKPLDLGYVVPLAPGKAAGVVLGRQSRGRMPFMLHYMMSVYRSRGWRNRFRILGDLGKELVSSGKE